MIKTKPISRNDLCSLVRRVELDDICLLGAEDANICHNARIGIEASKPIQPSVWKRIAMRAGIANVERAQYMPETVPIRRAYAEGWDSEVPELD